MPNSMSGTLTTDPSLDNSLDIPIVRFKFRPNDYHTPMEVEFDGDLAIEINENLKRGDKCTLFGICHSEGDPIRPFGIDYEQKSLPDKDEDQYEKILNLIENAAESMEKNPSIFSKMGEDALRTYLLGILNSCYEGQAIGEAFNCQGKTDILINSEGRSLFIAECKVWKGCKSLIAAIDQLLSYTSRHYTKVAVVIFSRNVHFSEVLKSIKLLSSKDHPNFKCELGQRSEISFQFIFSHPKDPNREITLTVMAFDVPK